MRYFQLHSHILRNHVGAKAVYYRVEDDMSEYETVVIGRNINEPWASLYPPSGCPFDPSDCDIITEKEYKDQYEYQNYLNSL